METKPPIFFKNPQVKDLFESYNTMHLCYNPYVDIDIITKKINNKKTFWNIVSSHPSKKAIELMINNLESINISRLCMNTHPNIGHVLDKIILEFDDEFNKEEKWFMSFSHNASVLEFLEKHPENINWEVLSTNTTDYAMHILEKNQDKIHWENLSSNSNSLAIKILQGNKSKINWSSLSSNSNHLAVELLKNNQDKIDWYELCNNQSLEAIEILEQNMDKITDYENLSKNPYAINILSQNLDKIHRENFSTNPNAMDILCEHTHLIDYFHFLRNPRAIPFFEKNMIKIKELIQRDLHFFNFNLNFNPKSIELIGKIVSDGILDDATLKSIINNIKLNEKALISVFELDYKKMSKARSRIIYLELLSKAHHPSRVEKWLIHHLDNGKSIEDFEY